MASPGRVGTQPGLSFLTREPVSRILFGDRSPLAVIPLGAALPRTLISDLPGGFDTCTITPATKTCRRGPRSSRLAASGRCGAPPGSSALPVSGALPSLFGLAPCGVCPARCITAAAVRSYRTFSPLLPPEGGSGSFSVALSLGLPPPDVIRHRMSMEPGLSSPSGLSARAGAAVRPTDVSLMGAKGHQVNPRWSRKIRQK
jgi:hypothetical protein